MRAIVIIVSIFIFNIACAQLPTPSEKSAILEQVQVYRNQEKYKKAYQLLKPLADNGDADANFALGELYDYSDDRNPYYDPNKSIDALYIAAKQGHAWAQMALGLNLKRRLRDIKDRNSEEFRNTFKESCDWKTKGALQGAQFGASAVAECHETGGFTGKPDYVQAYAWHAVSEILKETGNDSLEADFDNTQFMRQTAKRGKLTEAQKQQALKIARDIATQIKANLAKKPH